MIQHVRGNTRSNVASRKGSSCASAHTGCTISPFAPARARASRSMPSVVSRPTVCTPACASRESYPPGPQPTSSRFSPGQSITGNNKVSQAVGVFTVQAMGIRSNAEFTGSLY